MGHDFQRRTDTIRALADKHEGRCGDLLKDARYALNGAPRGVSTGAFTMYGFELATAHAVATEWADQDLKTKSQELTEFQRKLHVVAQCRDSAEAASTMRA